MRDRIVELLKQIATVMGARRCLGMVLHAKGRMFAVSDAGNRIVVEVAMRDFKVFWQALLFDCKTMVLGSDFNSSGCNIQNRLVGTAVTKLQLISLGS